MSTTPKEPTPSSTLGPLTRNHANIAGLGFLHLAALAAPFYLGFVQFHWGTLLLGVIWYGLCCVGITAGYHRSFSHRAYDTSRPLRWFYLLFGAAAMQTSALEWCADHRDHHSHTDGQKDPHSIKAGFFWAHMGWILNKRADRPEVDYTRVKDLSELTSFRLQKRFYWTIAILVGWILPGLIAGLWGDFVGGMLLAGGLRVTLMLHATWCVNSVAHVLGKRTYSLAISARDSLITALITGGEGYHNFHHKFPADYRNAVRWYQYDPTKWFIWTMGKIGLARNLRRTAPQLVLAARERVRSAA